VSGNGSRPAGVSAALVRILADMVDAALDRRDALRYASGHEKVQSLRQEVPPPDDVADLLQRGLQGEGLQETPPGE
jgi:hypothetical protein